MVHLLLRGIGTVQQGIQFQFHKYQWLIIGHCSCLPTQCVLNVLQTPVCLILISLVNFSNYSHFKEKKGKKLV